MALQQQVQVGLEQRPQTVLNKDFSENNPLKILIAEDNKINQMLILKILDKLGYAPMLANTGIEVIRMLDQQYFDLILMDVQMPEMDGLEATRYIRKYYAKQPHIIALTANAMIEDREACFKAGMNNYISKPIKIDLLIKLLQEAAGFTQ